MNAVLSSVRTIAAPLVMIFVLGGCATTYRFKVDAVRNQDVQEPKQAYTIVSANPEMDTEDLRFKEAEAYVKTALSSKGMFEAPPGADSQMVVEVDFGMEEPRTKFQTVSEPVYALVGGGTRTVTVPVTDSKGNTRYVTYVVYDPPQRELIGFRDRVITYQVYEKYLRITARETPGQAGDRPPRELWSVYVVNEDENDDLREYVPLMVSAAMDSINENASSKKDVVLKETDERVVFVKKGM
ncbi:MAG: hypothetical protein ACREIA_13775 [Opitutaceae bacterium]